jgi:hypothetical protein
MDSIIQSRHWSFICSQKIGAYIAEIITLEKYVEHKEDLLLQIVGTHQQNTNSSLFQTVNNFKKSLQSDTK